LWSGNILEGLFRKCSAACLYHGL